MDRRKFLLCGCWLLTAFFLSAQSEEESVSAPAAEEAVPVSSVGETPSLTVVPESAVATEPSPYDEVFKWGMENQVMETLRTILKENETVPDATLLSLYRQSPSSTVKAACLDYWRERRNPVLFEEILTYWSQLPQGDTVFQTAALAYFFAFLPEKGDGRTDAVLGDLIRYADFRIKSETVSLIAQKGMTGLAPVLMEVFQENDGETAWQAILLKALGTMKAEQAYSLLVDRLNDGDLSNDLRMAAAEGLGGYRTSAAFDVLLNHLSESNLFLRLKVFQALLSPENSQLDAVLQQGSKDEYWQIRKSVLQYIGGQRLNEYAPLLIFKAKNDPERTIREIAVRQMAFMSAAEIRTFLQETVKDKKQNVKMQSLAFDSLAGFGYANQIPFLVDLWTIHKEKPLKTVAEHMAMALSQTEEAGLEPMYELFFLSRFNLFRLYALRGIALNRSQACRADVERMQKSGKDDQLTREALKISYGEEQVGEGEKAAATETEEPFMEEKSAEKEPK